MKLNNYPGHQEGFQKAKIRRISYALDLYSIDCKSLAKTSNIPQYKIYFGCLLSNLFSHILVLDTVRFELNKPTQNIHPNTMKI